MKIRTRLKLNSWISVVVVLMMLISLVWSYRVASMAEENENLTADIRRTALESIILRDEYLLNRAERARIQYASKLETLKRLLEQARRRFTEPPDRALCEQIQRDLEMTNSIYSRITANVDQEKVLGKGSNAAREGEDRLIGQLMLSAYDLNGKITRLRNSTELASAAAQRRLVVLLICFICLVVVASIVNSALINRILAKRVAMISGGTEIIGTGNLDYRITVEGDDELSNLAWQTNEMAAKLQNSYVSLEKEIAVRKAANKELEAFSYSVSHDLRTPLRAINGFSKAVIEDYADKLDDEGKRMLNVISDNAKKMGQLIDDLLAFSRIGRQELKRKEIDMQALANAVALDLKQTVSGKTVHFDIKPMGTATGDSSMVRQVIINLLSNAIKFSEPRDSINIEIGSSTEEHDCVYYVKDHGVGFDMQYADKLFGVFQRLHSQEQFEGTGVGLALVQRIVHRHGGRIWAEGKVNEGATFYFTLPRMQGS